MGSARFFWIHDLGRYRADALIRCACGHERTMTMREFGLRRFCQQIHDVERRLTCTRCGARGQRIIPVPGDRHPLPAQEGALSAGGRKGVSDERA